MLNVVVVEDNDAIRDGLKILIDGTEGYACVGAFLRRLPAPSTSAPARS